MAEPKPYERSYSFRAFPDDEQNARQLGLLLDRQFDEVSNGEKDLAEVVSASRIDTVVMVPPDAEPSLNDGVLEIPRGETGAPGADGMDGASVYDTWLLENPGGTQDEFLEDMQATPTPALAAMLDQAESAAGTAVMAAGGASTSAGNAEISATAANIAAGNAVMAEEAAAQAAEEAATTAAGLSNTIVTIYYTEGAYPPRPVNEVVEFIGPVDPGVFGLNLMGPKDRWTWAPAGEAPLMPSPASWELMNYHDGVNLVVYLLSVMPYEPPIDMTKSIIDGGPAANLPGYNAASPIGPYVVPASAGLRAVQLQQHNFVGDGLVGPAKTVTVSSADGTDDFERANGDLSDDPQWRDVVTASNGSRLQVFGGAVRPEGALAYMGCQWWEYLPPHYGMTATILSAPNNSAGRRGIHLVVGQQRRDVAITEPNLQTGYRLRFSNTAWFLERYLGDNSPPTVLQSGTHATVWPNTAEIRFDTATGTVRCYLAGVQIGTDFVDPQPYTGRFASIGAETSGTDGAASAQIGSTSVGRRT